MPCSECGASVAVAEEHEHICDGERLVDFAVFQLRDEVSGLGAEIENYLSSPHGRFEQWFADRERRQKRPERPADERDP